MQKLQHLRRRTAEGRRGISGVQRKRWAVWRAEKRYHQHALVFQLVQVDQSKGFARLFRRSARVYCWGVLAARRRRECELHPTCASPSERLPSQLSRGCPVPRETLESSGVLCGGSRCGLWAADFGHPLREDFQTNHVRAMSRYGATSIWQSVPIPIEGVDWAFFAAHELRPGPTAPL